jgi:hypothetical protein
MERLKYLGNAANRVCIKIPFAGSFNSKSSVILFLIISCSQVIPNLLNAAGMVYWTPNGVLMSENSGVAGLVNDKAGGALAFGVYAESIIVIKIDRDGNLLWGLHGRAAASYVGYQGPLVGVSDSCGGAIAIWCKNLPQKLFCQLVDSLGNRKWGIDAQCVTLSDSAQWWPVICSDGAKGVITAWQENRDRTHSWDIYAQRIDSSGVRQWGDYGIAVCNADSSQESPKITCDNSGNSTVAWADMRNNNAVYNVYSQRLTISGSPVWQVNGITICDTSNSQVPTNIDMVTDTTIIVVWNDQRHGFANRDVYAQDIKINGLTQWIPQGIPICDTLNRQSSGQLVPDGQGGAIFCWVDERNGNRSIFAQRVNNFGLKLWGNQGNPICTADSCTSPCIVTDGESGAIICWQDRRVGNYDIYAQHVDSLGNILWDTNGMPVCTAVNNQQAPEMIASDSGIAIITWDDYRSGSARGYAQKVGDVIIAIKEQLQDTGYRMQDIRLEIYPNPFTRLATISFGIEHSAKGIELKIYDISGRMVRNFTDNLELCVLNHVTNVIWDGKDENNKKLPSGVYFCALKAGDYSKTKKIVFLK